MPFSLWFEKLGFLSQWKFQLDPVAFIVFGKTIAWYGIFICLGMILAFLVSSHKAKKYEGFTTDDFMDYMLFTIPLGVIGARAFYVITNLEDYPDFASMIALWNGGLAITGGIIFGIVTIVAVSLVKKKNCLRILDAVAPGVLLAQAIGRWGNFFNGEVFGLESSLPWAMSLEINGRLYLNRHPLFFYEFVLNLVGCALIMLFYKKKRFHGQHTCFYLLWYGGVRSLLEPLRDATYQLKMNLFGTELLFSQVISILILLAGIGGGIAGYILRKKKPFTLEEPAPSTPDPQDALETITEEAKPTSLSCEDSPEEIKTENTTDTEEEKEISHDTQNS